MAALLLPVQVFSVSSMPTVWPAWDAAKVRLPQVSVQLFHRVIWG